MYYSETKVIMGGLAHVPILILIVNYIKGKFEAVTATLVELKKEESKIKAVDVKEEEVIVVEAKANEVKEEEVKVVEAKTSDFKDGEE